jgi:DNA-binding GntR family transcriptional regulator
MIGMRAATEAQVFSIGQSDWFETAVAPIGTQSSLSARILRSLRRRGADIGYRVRVAELCQELDAPPVSVRKALNLLGARGTLDWFHGREFVLAAPIGRPVRTQAEASQSLLMQAVLCARDEGALASECSSDDVARTLDVRKIIAVQALNGLERLGLAERDPGPCWCLRNTVTALLESYRLRLAVEPLSLLSPLRRTDSVWLSQMGQRHRTLLADGGDAESFSRLDGEFHRQLAGFSGNRFMSEAIGQQVEIAGLTAKHSIPELMRDVEEHLAILTALERGKDGEAASLLMRHLETMVELLSRHQDAPARL